MQTFKGRKEEIAKLEELCQGKESKLVCIYGRRRVGKSTLIKEFAIKAKSSLYLFEGIEDQHTPEQIKHFSEVLSKYLDDELIAKAEFRTWNELFYLLNSRLLNRKNKNKKIIIAFDELQWMAAKQSKLISLIKYFWDNVWKEHNIVLILCGSVATFMVDKVIHSKALYGRINCELLLQPLDLEETRLLFQNKRSSAEILKYSMIFGGIPKYIEEINLNRSLRQNMQRLCFEANGYMVDEFEKIFYSQFKETQTYIRIVELLNHKKLSLNEIAAKLKMTKSGGLQRYIINLEKAQIISSYQPSIVLYKSNKNLRYGIIDEYIIFYFKFIKPNRKLIKKNTNKDLFIKLCESQWLPWLGLAFERLIYKNAKIIADRMGFADEVIDYSPYFDKENQVQIDLIYIRTGKIITVCEIKYQEKEITTKIIPEMQAKIKKLKIPDNYTIETALISVSKPHQTLIDSGYFDHYLSLKDIMKH